MAEEITKVLSITNGRVGKLSETSRDGQYVAVSYRDSPYLEVYRNDGNDNYTKLSVTFSTTAGMLNYGYRYATFSPTGRFLIVVLDSTTANDINFSIFSVYENTVTKII